MHLFSSQELGGTYSVVYQTDSEVGPQEKPETQGLPVHIASRYSQQLLRALRYLRSLNWVHTDIKPDNIFWMLSDRDAQVRNVSNAGGGGGAAASSSSRSSAVEQVSGENKWEKL